MAISTSLGIGASGIQIFQNALTVVSNNIANTDTVAFKENDIAFSEMISQFSGSLNFQIGRGALVHEVRSFLKPGTLKQTNSSLDMTIEGNGFFVVADPLNSALPLFTRAGNFKENAQGLVVTPAGFLLQGAPITVDPVTGAKTSGKAGPIDLSGKTAPPKATTKVDLTLNLFSDEGESIVIGTEPTNLDSLAGGALILNGIGVGPIGTASNAAERVTALMDAINGLTDTTGIVASQETPTSIRLTHQKGEDVIVDFNLDLDPDVAVKTGLQKSKQILTGTVLASSGSNLVEGTNTKFTEELKAGDAIVIGTTRLTVQSVQSDTKLTVTQKIAEGLSGSVVRKASTASTPITIFDSLGTARVIDVRFQKIGTNEWEWNAVVAGNDNLNGSFDEVQATGRLSFTERGQLDPKKAPTSSLPTGGFDFKGGSASNQQIAFNFSGTANTKGGGATQFGSPTRSLILSQKQDGFAAGVLQSVSVDSEGFINGLFSNGVIAPLFQVTVALFPNAEGLTRIGDSLYIQSDRSGEQIQGTASSGGRGKIRGNSLEQSTVELSTQFVNLIAYQRGFQANSRVITTSDEVIQEVVNLKR